MPKSIEHGSFCIWNELTARAADLIMSRAGQHGRPTQADLVYLSAEPSVSHNLVTVVRVLTVLLNFRSSASQTSLLSIPPPPTSPVSGIVIVSCCSSPYSGD